jgi:hypothetical protein
MRRYFFQIQCERGTQEDSAGIAISGHSAAMLHAVTMCAEIGCSSEFHSGFTVVIRDEHRAAIGLVSVVVAIAALERRDA